MSNTQATQPAEIVLPSSGDGEFDARTATSPENGKKGGRPRAPAPNETAFRFMAEELLDGKNKTARHWRDVWYCYGKGGWSPTSEGEMLKRLVSWLQTKPNELSQYATINYARNVLANLSAFGLCGIRHDVAFPCFLSTGEDARNWVAFSNGFAVDVWGYAQAMAAGDSADVAKFTRQVSPDFFSTDFVSYAFDAKAEPPAMFIAYLNRVLPDADSRAAVIRMLGIMLADVAKYEVFYQLYGKGANGKTVLLDIIEALVGRQNTSRVSLESLAPGTRFQSFPLVAAKVNISGELRTDIGSGNLAAVEGEFKHAVSGGTIEVERKGVDKTFARCRARFVMSANSLPTFVDRSDAIWRRLRVIPFTVQIPPAEQDADLASKIVKAEMPGIAMMAIEGLACVIRDGIVRECQAGAEMKAAHRATCDHERDFLMEKYEKAGPDAKVPSKDIYQEYRDWTVANGYRSMGSAKFFARVEDVISTSKHGNIRTLDGIVKGFTGLRRRVVADVAGTELTYE